MKGNPTEKELRSDIQIVKNINRLSRYIGEVYINDDFQKYHYYLYL